MRTLLDQSRPLGETAEERLLLPGPLDLLGLLVVVVVIVIVIRLLEVIRLISIVSNDVGGRAQLDALAELARCSRVEDSLEATEAI